MIRSIALSRPLLPLLGVYTGNYTLNITDEIFLLLQTLCCGHNCPAKTGTNLPLPIPTFFYSTHAIISLITRKECSNRGMIRATLFGGLIF